MKIVFLLALTAILLARVECDADEEDGKLTGLASF